VGEQCDDFVGTGVDIGDEDVDVDADVDVDVATLTGPSPLTTSLSIWRSWLPGRSTTGW
jgi:hypothetical protein